MFHHKHQRLFKYTRINFYIGSRRHYVSVKMSIKKIRKILKTPKLFYENHKHLDMSSGPESHHNIPFHLSGLEVFMVNNKKLLVGSNFL